MLRLRSSEEATLSASQSILPRDCDHVTELRHLGRAPFVTSSIVGAERCPLRLLRMQRPRLVSRPQIPPLVASADSLCSARCAEKV